MQNVPTPVTAYALFCSGEYLTNEQMNDKKFIKLVSHNCTAVTWTMATNFEPKEPIKLC